MTREVLREERATAAGATSVAAIAWRYGGALRVTVIAKASFAFARDAAMARGEAQPIFRADVHHGQSPVRSIRFSSDLAPYLHRGEVFFTGHAYAPGGGQTEAMSVRLGIFDEARALVDKTVLVRKRGGFQKMPLVYEQAFGGIGWPDNPLGVGALAGRHDADPTVFDPAGDELLAGFGPIGQAWPARRRLLGTTPRKALALEGPVVEIPEGFDWGYFQAAPPDQRLGFLRGDEWIVMDGLHQTLPRLRMRLPGARGLSRVYGLGPFGVTEGQPLVLHADTLRIDGDELRCTLTFRGVFPVASKEALAAVRVVAGVELPGVPIAWPDPAATPRTTAPATASEPGPAPFGEATITLDDDAFESVDGEAFAGTMVPAEDGPHRPLTLPFQGGASLFAQPSGHPGDVFDHPLGGTMAQTQGEQARAAARSAVPFGAPATAAPAPARSSGAQALMRAAPSAAVPEGQKKEEASPWAPAPAPEPAAPAALAATRAAPHPQALPAASPALKKGLYGRFAGKR